MNPKRWTIICWFLVILWSCPAITGNIAVVPDLPASADSVHLIGFPIIFIRIANNPPVVTYYFFWHTVNISIAVLVLLSLIYSVQTLAPRFSIKTLIFGVTATALLVSVGLYIFNTGNLWALDHFFSGIYLSPLLGALIALISRISWKTSNAE